MINEYHSMDELRADVERMRLHVTPKEYDLILYAYGLLENQGVCEEVNLQDKLVKIDRYLIPMIKDINQRGIVTMACCSGLSEEHQGVKFPPSAGYLCIQYTQQLHKQLSSKNTDPIITINQSTCYLNPCISITIHSTDDTILKEKWNTVWNLLKQLH